MSREAIEKFYEIIGQDEDLQNRMREATDEAGFLDLALQLGGDKGCDFTKEELSAHMDTLQESMDAELSEAELEQVAGGLSKTKVSSFNWTNTYSGCANCDKDGLKTTLTK